MDPSILEFGFSRECSLYIVQHDKQCGSRPSYLDTVCKRSRPDETTCMKCQIQFSERVWHFMQIVSSGGDNLHEMSILFFLWMIKENKYKKKCRLLKILLKSALAYLPYYWLLFFDVCSYVKRNARSVANNVDRDRTPRSVVSDLICTVCSGLVGLNT